MSTQYPRVGTVNLRSIAKEYTTKPDYGRAIFQAITILIGDSGLEQIAAAVDETTRHATFDQATRQRALCSRTRRRLENRGGRCNNLSKGSQKTLSRPVIGAATGVAFADEAKRRCRRAIVLDHRLKLSRTSAKSALVTVTRHMVHVCRMSCEEGGGQITIGLESSITVEPDARTKREEPF